VNCWIILTDPGNQLLHFVVQFVEMRPIFHCQYQTIMHSYAEIFINLSIAQNYIEHYKAVELLYQVLVQSVSLTSATKNNYL
jgi:hypothetical protein